MVSSIQEDDFDTIESGYEFLLAYAAQGRPPHKEGDMPPPHAGPTLQNMLDAMQRIAAALADSKDDFEQLIVEDIRKASAAVGFTVSQPLMSSELVDNLNASIHLRAVLTNSFLYSEKFRPSAEAKVD
jgi:hypothetical protein